MNTLPFYLVPLTHDTWEKAQACARSLPADALPELRLDLFPDLDPETLVRDLKGRCLLTCRRSSEGGRFDGSEADRQTLIQAALQGRPSWLDWEWDLPIPDWLAPSLTHIRLIRSVHVEPGVLDLMQRLESLPPGDAWKWVGHAHSLGDNGLVRKGLALARNRQIRMSAFLMGPKGIPGRVLQAAWGGSFTYAAPDDGPPAAPGQIPLRTLKAWRASKLTPACGLCGVLGSPVGHSRGPAFHNPRFQRAFKDLIYLPLDCGDAEEAREALDALSILGASITAPLKETLPAALGLEGPLNTLWRRDPSQPWLWANTDALALEAALRNLQKGTVLLLGDGGVATATRRVLEEAGWPVVQTSRKQPCPVDQLEAPVGVIQATTLGMKAEDPLPFPAHLERARPSLRWAMEWIYKEDTAFSRWAEEAGLHLVSGAELFDAQAEAQSQRFISGCGEAV